jgi:lipoic acid synthetase
MILGDVCTRFCGFCSVKTGKPDTLDTNEPERLAQAVKNLSLRHVVITSVARDDLQDGGASIFAACIQRIHDEKPDVIVEVLTPDFQGKQEQIQIVLDAAPEIYNHNIETVERLTPSVRSHRATYRQTLNVLAYAKSHQIHPHLKTKSGFMLGLGETDAEVTLTLKDLRSVGCDYLTVGQYLQPSTKHLQIQSFAPIARFDEIKQEAFALGFERVASGPLVRSSYFADQLHESPIGV